MTSDYAHFWIIYDKWRDILSQKYAFKHKYHVTRHFVTRNLNSYKTFFITKTIFKMKQNFKLNRAGADLQLRTKLNNIG